MEPSSSLSIIRRRHQRKEFYDNYLPFVDPAPTQGGALKHLRDSKDHSRANRTPQEAYLEEELDKILVVEDEGGMISPFVDFINEANLPLRFTRPNVAYYDDTIDPKVFLSHFRYTMLNQKCTHVHMCKLFP